MKKKKMGLGDVTNGIGAKVQKLGKICAHKKMVNCNRWWGSRNIDMGVILEGSYTRMVKPIIGLNLGNRYLSEK